MNKKNKTKKTRKLLPVLLCIVLILSMFTLSAFAEETECDINGHQPSDSNFNGVEGECVYRCAVCGEEVKCYATFISVDTPECGTETTFSYCDTYNLKEDGSVEVGVFFACNCEDGHSPYGSYLLTPIVDTPETENTSIITSITTDLVGSIGVFLGGIGESLVTFFDTVVTTTNAEGKRTLTTFAGWSIAFLGIGFGSMFIRKLMKKAS